MRYVFLVTLLSACATREPYTGEYWTCNALSEFEETHTIRGHWGRCEGTEWCAREEALKHCLWRHPKDCEVVTCVKSPDLPQRPKLKTDEELLSEDPLNPKPL